MNREDLLVAAAGGRRSKLVEVPGWPDKVLVCEFGALDAVLWRRSLPKPPGDLPADPAEAFKVLEAALPAGEELRSAAKMIVLCTYKADGSAKLFEYDDWLRVANLPRAVLELLMAAANEVNGTTQAALQEATEDFAPARS